MRLKTFKAPTMAAALEKARREMGSDALVLATNTTPGRLGLTSVEITVGVDRPLEESAEERLRELSSEIVQLRERLSPATTANRGRSERSSLPSFSGTAPAAAPSRAAEPRIHPALLTAKEALMCTGLSADLATRFATIAARNLTSPYNASKIADATEKGVASLVSFSPDLLRSRVLFLVGPPGSGKTTTVAKLAARMSFDQNLDVVVCQSDFERIGSMEQARIFARNIGSSLVPTNDPDIVRRLVDDATENSAVIVDTAGIGAADTERLDTLVAMRVRVPEADVALLIPAGLHRDAARSVIKRFAPVAPTCAVLSKVDDGERLGDLVSALAPSKLPLSFITNGHSVPGDLETATASGIAALMLRSGHAVRESQEMH